MRVAVCLYGDVRQSVSITDAFVQFGYQVDVYVHKKFTDPYPADLAPRCCWLEEPRPISRPEGVSEEQMWVYWSMARLGKMVIQTEQKEGRYGLGAFAAPQHCLSKPLPPGLLDGKVHVLGGASDKLAIGPSTDMQLYLNKISQLQTYRERFVERSVLGHQDRDFAEWCLNGQDEKRKMNWVEDLQ